MFTEGAVFLQRKKNAFETITFVYFPANSLPWRLSPWSYIMLYVALERARETRAKKRLKKGENRGKNGWKWVKNGYSLIGNKSMFSLFLPGKGSKRYKKNITYSDSTAVQSIFHLKKGSGHFSNQVIFINNRSRQHSWVDSEKKIFLIQYLRVYQKKVNKMAIRASTDCDLAGTVDTLTPLIRSAGRITCCTAPSTIHHFLHNSIKIASYAVKGRQRLDKHLLVG